MELSLTADSSWNRWHPTYDELGARCARLDIHAVELAYYPQNDGFDKVVETLAGYGARITCVNATAKHRLNVAPDVAEAQQRLLEVIELADEVGAKYVVTYPGHNEAWNWKEDLELYRRRLDPCLQAATDRGITLLLENHFDIRGEDPRGRDVVRDPDLTALYVEAFGSPNLRINFDAGNLYAAGIEPWPYAYRTLRDYIAYAHLKDMARFSELLFGPADDNELLSDSRAGTFVPVALGDGGINYAGLLQDFARDGVAEFIAFEDHSNPQNAEQIYDRGVAFTRAMIARAETAGAPPMLRD